MITEQNKIDVTEVRPEPISANLWSDKAVERLLNDLFPEKKSTVTFLGDVWGCPKVLEVND